MSLKGKRIITAIPFIVVIVLTVINFRITSFDNSLSSADLKSVELSVFDKTYAEQMRWCYWDPASNTCYLFGGGNCWCG